MAGGEGSRLRPLTSRRPKPLVPVAGTPIMEHILTLLREHGIQQVIVTLQYLGAEIRNYFGDGSDFGMEIEYVVEDHPLGTAGSVGNARQLLDDTFLVISGDALTDIDLSWAVQQHRERRALATIVLYSVSNPLEYGVVITEPDGAVRRFLEKPSWGEVFSDQANTGIYVIEPQVLDRIQPGVPVDWSQDVFPAMLADADPLYGVVAQGYWCDVGNVQSYLQANWDALEGKVRCQIAGRRHEGNVFIGDGVEFGIGVRIDGPAFIADDAKIKAAAWINGPAVIDRFSVIDDGAKLSNSIIWRNSYIGERTRLRQSIVCRNVTIKNDCLLEDDTIVGDECHIGEGTRLDAGVKLWPHKDIQPGSKVRESVIWAGEWRRRLFGSYGIGGLINVELTPEFCAGIGAAYAATLPKGATIAVTRDHSRSSRMIKRAIIAGIVSAGASVRDLSELPVPVTQFATRVGDCAAGIHVLESPLDLRSADIRLFDGKGLQIDKRGERKVENLFFREDFRRAAFYEIGEIGYQDPLDDYIGYIMARIDADIIRQAALHILVDYDYSAPSLVLPQLLDRLGVTTIPLHAGFGETYRPKPPDQFREAREQAALITRTLEAHAGCYLGPSGDRLYLIDDSGALLDFHQGLGVVATLVLEQRPAAVLAPAAAPRWLERAVAAAGGRLVATRSDPGSVLRASLYPEAVLAADDLGGFVWPEHIPAFDACYTVIRLLELLARSTRPLSQVRAELPAGVHLSHREFCPWDVKGRVMRILLEQLRDEQLDLADGIKVVLDDGYVLLLPDPDTPHYHVVVSLDSNEDRAHELLEQYTLRVLRAAESDGAEISEVPVTEEPSRVPQVPLM